MCACAPRRSEKVQGLWCDTQLGREAPIAIIVVIIVIILNHYFKHPDHQTWNHRETDIITLIIRRVVGWGKRRRELALAQASQLHVIRVPCRSGERWQ